MKFFSHAPVTPDSRADFAYYPPLSSSAHQAMFLPFRDDQLPGFCPQGGAGKVSTLSNDPTIRQEFNRIGLPVMALLGVG